MKSKYKEKANRRYYLHKKVRDQGYNLDSYAKTISIKPNEMDNISKSVKSLMEEFGYL